jgi:thiamine biosynthesis protein ThiS
MDLWINGSQRVFEIEPSERLTLASVIGQLGWSSQKVAVELNGLVVPKNEHVNTDLKNNDKIEIVTLIGGG